MWPGLVAVALAASATSVGAASYPPAAPKLEAEVVPYDEARVEEMSVATFDGNGRPLKATTWRVVSGTGNDRENYLAATKDGMLLDFGGEWIRFSTDDGRTWSQVLPAEELRPWYGYEGTVAVAPGGDVVAFAQDYPPGLALTFKYEAASRKWFYSTSKMHAPALDRPALGVLPGPFTIGPLEVPYVSVIRGGFFLSKTPWYYSFDGLNYAVPNSRAADAATGSSSEALRIEPWEELDWVQPHELNAITPFGRGHALAEKPSLGAFDLDATAPRTILDPGTLRWSAYSFPGSGPEQGQVTDLAARGRTLVDSTGLLHHTSMRDAAIVYKTSADGGATWATRTFPLLPGYGVTNGGAGRESAKSFKVNGAAATAAVVVHAIKQMEPLVTQDLVYRFSLRDGLPRLKRIYALGAADFGCRPGGLATTTAPDGNCDFPSVVLLPGGRIAASFTDAAHPEPSIAVQLQPGRA